MSIKQSEPLSRDALKVVSPGLRDNEEWHAYVDHFFETQKDIPETSEIQATLALAFHAGWNAANRKP